MFKLNTLKGVPLIPFFILMYQTSICQITIEGIIADSTTNQPVSYVTAYLANTSIGANSDDEGKFILSNVPIGTYELIFSFIGYEKRSQRIKLESNIRLIVNAKLLPQTKQLGEVVVTSQKNKDWEMCFKQFKKDFLGYTPNSSRCKIVNPEMLNFSYNKKEKKITGSSQGFLIIENKALGYKIRYELSDYLSDKEKGFSSYYGNAFYEEFAAKNKQQNDEWKNKREKAYKGSFQHFVRALLDKKLSQEGFQLLNASVYKEENILTEQNILKTTQFPNILTMNYKDFLLINYLNEPEDEIYKSMRHTYSLSPDSHQSSALVFAAQTIVATNGYIYNPLSVIRQGYWAYENMAEMLPLNYELQKKADR